MVLSIEEIEKRIHDSYELPNRVLDTMPEPMVTVRTSTYQHAPYIKQCIEGVLMQKTTFPFEFIIGEDFSTDGTREIVFEYAKKYPEKIRVFTADYNVGAKANSTRCRKAFRGKYVAICEGDDYWTDPYKLQKQVDFLEANPEYGLVYTEFNRLNETTKTIEKEVFKNKLGLYPNIFEDFLINAWFLAPCTWVIRKRLLNEYLANHLPKPNWPGGSLSILLWISRQYKVFFLHDITSVYRVLPESASHFKSLKKAYLFRKGVFEIQCYFSGNNIKFLDKIKKKYYTNSFFEICLFADKENKKEVYNFLCRYNLQTLKYKVFFWLSFNNVLNGLMRFYFQKKRYSIKNRIMGVSIRKVRKKIGGLSARLSRIKAKIEVLCRLMFLKGKTIFLFGYPIHPNMGMV